MALVKCLDVVRRLRSDIKINKLGLSTYNIVEEVLPQVTKTLLQQINPPDHGTSIGQIYRQSKPGDAVVAGVNTLVG